MKALLPWLCFVGALVGLAFTYLDGQKKDAELAALRTESQELQKLRTEMEDAKGNQSQTATEELARLRKDHDELLRLRNEINQLRTQKTELDRKVQAAEVQAQGAQAQMQALSQKAAQAAQAAPSPEAQALAARYGLPPGTPPDQVNALVCLNNLRQIDAAKQQWAVEHGRPAGALLTAADLFPVLKTNTLPACPAGGVYTLNPVGLSPLCNIPGHALAK